MSTATAQANPKKKAANQPKRITKEQFLRSYTNREDGNKYEWNNGVVEKTSAMNQSQSKYFYLLLKIFLQTDAAKSGGMLITETDMDTTPLQLRRPDISFYTGEQLPLMWAGENQIAPWIAEVISPTDRAEAINEKMQEYFAAGVQVLWHIYPHSEMVYVYTSPDDVVICREKTICNGAPAIPGFEIKAGELFS